MNTHIFHAGQMVEWDQDFVSRNKWVIEDHGLGPFRVRKVEPTYGNMRDAGHSQYVTIVDPRSATGEARFSGIFFKPA